MHHFLPEEYPQSVSQGYLAYQGWLFLQWVLQSFTYMFSTYALLSSVGVANAMPLSAAMNWVLKDGLGCVGMMLAASRLGGRVDENPKRTKLLADACFHVGVAMEMLLLLPSEHDPLLWIVVASVANALKAMSGLIGGACRASLNSTFALQQNLGDITAKSQSQSTMGYLIGMLGGIPLSRVTGEDSGRIILAVAAFSAGALYCSSKALSAVPLRSLNGHRAALLFRAHISSKQTLSIEQVRAQERFF
ncbi:MAG: RUS1 family protein, partial [archaeon]|nr:RUS1 family protein [archaeon]